MHLHALLIMNSKHQFFTAKCNRNQTPRTCLTIPKTPIVTPNLQFPQLAQLSSKGSFLIVTLSC